MTSDKGIFIKNIYYMLSYAYKELQKDSYKKLKTEDFDNFHDLIASILIKSVSLQLKKGLNRKYIEKNEDLYTLRGKVNIRDSIKKQVYKSKKISCKYDEFSENNILNQVLKTTLYKLILCNELKEEKKYEIKKIMMYFSEVDLVEISNINWNSFQYHRNNATYRLLINICYLVLKSMILTTEKGKERLASYLDDQQMHRLYEKFILEYYKKHFPELRPKSKQIFWDTEDVIDFLPNMQSDIMLSYEDKKLIIDAKYYKESMQSHHDSNKLRSSHLYQIFAYVKNEDKHHTGLVSGMLLYAKTEEEILPNYEYNIGGNIISAKTLDLNKPFEMIKRQLESIILNWLGEDFIRKIN